MQNSTRRRVLKSAALLPFAALPNVPDDPKKPERAVRFAYIGDTHVTTGVKPARAIAACLHHLQNQADKPQFVLHGGDVIMDALGADKTNVTQQWVAWQQLVRAECSLPIDYCIGNHDVWGFADARQDPKWGKVWVQDTLQLSNRYRSFVRNGWKFIVLDSTQPNAAGGWYTAYVDPEQYSWLENELAGTPTTQPILLLSHIPILTATAFYDDKNVRDGNWQIPGSWVHTDAVRLMALFYRYPNVRVALSGHMHLLDQVVYNNVTYLCNGAVSGNWWANDTFHQTQAGYALIDLFPDGHVERTYVPQPFA